MADKMHHEAWIYRLLECDPEILPHPFTWKIASKRIAALIDGYGLLKEVGENIGDFADIRFREATKIGGWRGSVVELWICMFFAQRRQNHGAWAAIADEEYQRREEEDRRQEELLLDKLCEAFRVKFMDLSMLDRILLSRSFRSNF